MSEIFRFLRPNNHGVLRSTGSVKFYKLTSKQQRRRLLKSVSVKQRQSHLHSSMRNHLPRSKPLPSQTIMRRSSRVSAVACNHIPFFLVLLSVYLPMGANASEIRCVTAGSGDQPVLLPAERVNDGYCDCIDTFADEPETSACAGSEDWPRFLVHTNDDGSAR